MRRTDRLLHYIAQRAGLVDTPLARRDHRLDVQQLAAHRGPGQPGHAAHLILLVGQTVAVTAYPGILLYIVGGEEYRRLSPLAFVFEPFAKHLAAYLGDLPLELAHARLTSVVANQLQQRLIGEAEFVLLEAGGPQLLRHQVAPGNGELLVLGVARQANHLHAVQQRAGNVHRVGGTDEHHLGEIVVELKVMIVELVVLLRIEHLEQRRGRVAAVVHAELVDLVEQEQRVLDPGLAHALDQLAGQRTDVGAAMSANFGFIAHAAQRQAHVLAVGGSRDRLAQRGLAHPGRAHQAQHGSLELLDALLHGQILEDTLLDLLEAVVVLVEHLVRMRQVVLDPGTLLPGHAHHPVEVGTHHGGFRRTRRHHLELAQLLQGLLPRLLGHARLFDGSLVLLGLVGHVLELAHLLLDGLHLLVEIVLALGLLHLVLDPRADALLHLEQVDLRFDQRH